MSVEPIGAAMKREHDNSGAWLKRSRADLGYAKNLRSDYDQARDYKMRLDLRMLASVIWRAAADLDSYVLTRHGYPSFSNEDRDVARAQRAASTPAQRAAARVVKCACKTLYYDLFIADEGTIEDVEEVLPQIKNALADLEDEWRSRSRR
jgi:hypothetical protein